jgi:hypothetical protein
MERVAQHVGVLMHRGAAKRLRHHIAARLREIPGRKRKGTSHTMRKFLRKNLWRFRRPTKRRKAFGPVGFGAGMLGAA